MADEVRLPPERVVAELCSEPLGKALWERAQYLVLSTIQSERLAQMENRSAPTESPSQGWEVPDA